VKKPVWLRSGVWFGLVGVAAALTHMGVFALLRDAWWPELANAAGFGVAFFVSFAGHRWLSFSGSTTSVGQSFRRFAVTALAGFACNELSFMLFFRLWGWPSLLALFLAMVVAAVQTFVFSRFWAFAR
jgi:putative flippase GtrA